MIRQICKVLFTLAFVLVVMPLLEMLPFYPRFYEVRIKLIIIIVVSLIGMAISDYVMNKIKVS